MRYIPAIELIVVVGYSSQRKRFADAYFFIMTVRRIYNRYVAFSDGAVLHKIFGTFHVRIRSISGHGHGKRAFYACIAFKGDGNRIFAGLRIIYGTRVYFVFERTEHINVFVVFRIRKPSDNELLHIRLLLRNQRIIENAVFVKARIVTVCDYSRKFRYEYRIDIYRFGNVFDKVFGIVRNNIALRIIFVIGCPCKEFILVFADFAGHCSQRYSRAFFYRSHRKHFTGRRER